MILHSWSTSAEGSVELNNMWLVEQIHFLKCSGFLAPHVDTALALLFVLWLEFLDRDVYIFEVGRCLFKSESMLMP